VETSRLVWFDRSGRQIGVLGEAADLEGLRLSPDGSRCAIEIRDPRTGTIDIWIGDVARGVTTRLTSGGAINDSPVWSPDGERLVFSSNRTGQFDLYEVPSRGGAEQRLLTSTDGKAPTDWSSNGHDIAFHESGPSTGYKWEVWKMSVPDRTATPLLQKAANQTAARFSPDGAWVAYCSDESGSQEVYVQAAAGGGGKRQVSKGGGCPAAWRRDGKELFYLAPDNRIMAVPVLDDKSLSLGPAEALFTTRVDESASDIPLFDATADGRQFLVNTRTEGEDFPLTVVVNWISAPGR
jgi:Tol biopolymer transport system component